MRTSSLSFQLDKRRVVKFQNSPEPFKDQYAKLVYLRSYSRTNNDGTRETWYDTCYRVVCGAYSIMKQHMLDSALYWDEDKAQRSAAEMFERMYTMKFTPPGRGLFAMGVPEIHKRSMFSFLFNCSFVSTDDIAESLTNPFVFAMTFLLAGCGVGFDTEGAGKIMIYKPSEEHRITDVIEDSREGWAESINALLTSYFYSENVSVDFDYSKIRPKGSPIKSINGLAPGPEPLKKCHEIIRKILDENAGELITETTIVDLFNVIGKAVVSGGIRRSAEIALGRPDSQEFINLKSKENLDKVLAYRHNSNNSIKAEVGMDYSNIVENIIYNGEPGIIWIDNARKYSRMNGTIDNRDINAGGTNPCSEQTLESWELCNLVEIFPSHHEDIDDFLRTCKYAYLYSKIVSLTSTELTRANVIMTRNRRLGIGLSGIVDFLGEHNINDLKEWCENGYDRIKELDVDYSRWLGINESIKLTTVKPSGTVSAISSVTPGVHFNPGGKYYIRRVEFRDDDPLVAMLRDAGYIVTDSVNKGPTTKIVWFPMKYHGKGRSACDVDIWEKVQLAKCLQEWWSDNQVSVTVTFKDEEKNQIKPILDYYQYHLKSISFLSEYGSDEEVNNILDIDKLINYNYNKTTGYSDLPIEPITEGVYDMLVSRLTEVDYTKYNTEAQNVSQFCDSDKCELDLGGYNYGKDEQNKD